MSKTKKRSPLQAALAEYKHLDSNEQRKIRNHMEEVASLDYHMDITEKIRRYVEWCEQHGLGTELVKSKQKRKAELRKKDEAAVHVLRNRIKAKKNAGLVLEKYAAGELGARGLGELNRSSYDAVTNFVRSKDFPQKTLPLLMRVVEQRKMCEGRHHNQHMLVGVVEMCRHHKHWIRGPEKWKPKSHNRVKQFASLSRHLFAEYDVPQFLDSVWFVRHENPQWFWHIGQGGNIRTASDLPCKLTKRMAHLFLHANAETATDAIRCAQVLSLDGNYRTINGLRETRMYGLFDNEDFWFSVIRFFIDNPMLDTVHYGPIIDYILFQRFNPGPQPNMSMKRRNAMALLEQVDRWHNELQKVNKCKEKIWMPSAIKPFEVEMGNPGGRSYRFWTVQELTTSDDLFKEGRAMQHCVASYARSCAEGRVSIWSMKCVRGGVNTRELTIEVNPRAHTIVQARGLGNARPTPEQSNILHRWALHAGLSLGRYVI